MEHYPLKWALTVGLYRIEPISTEKSARYGFDIAHSLYYWPTIAQPWLFRPALTISPQISPKLYIYIHACSAIQFRGNEIFSTLMIIYTPLIIRECSPYLIWNLYILFPISLNTSCRRYNSYSSAFLRWDEDEVIDLQFTPAVKSLSF